MRKILLSITLLLLAVTTASLWMTRGDIGARDAVRQSAQGEGEVQIGGRFALTDTSGKEVRESDFYGRVMLVFFGFTHCPDICPITVASLSQAMELLGEDANEVAPVFITVDPERDTPQVMKDYLSGFDKRMVGLTGSLDQIRDVTSGYKAYFAKSSVPWEEGDADIAPAAGGHAPAAHGQHAGHGMTSAYTVNHSGFIYMIGRDGKYVRHFPYNASAEEIAEAVKSYIK